MAGQDGRQIKSHVGFREADQRPTKNPSMLGRDGGGVGRDRGEGTAMNNRVQSFRVIAPLASESYLRSPPLIIPFSVAVWASLGHLQDACLMHSAPK